MAEEKDRQARVWWLFRNFYPDLAGGSERFRRYYPGLCERGIGVEVLTSTGEPELAPVAMGEDFPLVTRIYLDKPTPGEVDKRLLQEILNLPKNAHTRGKVIQVAGIRWTNLIALLKLKSRGYRILMTSTIIGIERGNSSSRLRQLMRRIVNFLEHRICDKIVVSSSVMGKNRVEMGASWKQIEIISNGVDIRRYVPCSSEVQKEVRGELKIPQDAQVLLYMGGMVPRKRIHLIIDAFRIYLKNHDNALLYLVGPMKRPTMFSAEDQDELVEYQAQLREIAGDLLDKSIFFTGESLSPEKWFRAADVFTFCPMNEGFGNVLVEAMSSGLPVVTTDFIGFAEELGEAGTHFLKTEDTPEAIAAAVDTVLNNRQLRKDLISHARKQIEEEHDLEVVLDRYAAIYKELANT